MHAWNDTIFNSCLASHSDVNTHEICEHFYYTLLKVIENMESVFGFHALDSKTIVSATYMVGFCDRTRSTKTYKSPLTNHIDVYL